MLKKTNVKCIWTLLAIGFLVIPVADFRILPSLPLYPLDYICLALIVLSVYLLSKENLQEKDFYLKIMAILGIINVSALLSLVFNNPTATGFGQLKSWVILPAFAGITTAFVLFQNKNRNFLTFWFCGIISLLFIALIFFFLGELTFDGRLQGPFTSPNFLAFFLFPGSLLSFYFWKNTPNNKSKLLFFLLGIAFLVTLFLTHSFGGWLALAGAFGWYIFHSEKLIYNPKLLLLAFGIASLFLFFELSTSNKFETILEERSSLASRITIWTVATTSLQENPVWGIGIGNFQNVYLSYQSKFPAYLEWAVPQPHNIFLALWLQFGILGFIAMIILLWQALRQPVGSNEYLLIQAIFFGMILYGLFDTPLFGNALAFLFWAVLAFLLFPERKEEN